MSETIQLVPSSVAGRRFRVAAFVALTKPRITGMVLVACAVGFQMGWPAAAGLPALPLLLHTLIGTALVTGGANALNQYLEAEYDRLMQRTQNRPIPSGRVSGIEALVFAAITCVAGGAYLSFFVNGLAAAIGAFAVLSYAFAYTPLKRISPLSVFVGAVPGALPPVIGWAAAADSLGTGAMLLFSTMFFWQLPHFAAIAWMYRRDYALAGYPVLAVVDSRGTRTDLHMMTHSVALIAASLLPVMYGLAGAVYGVGALAIGGGFLAMSALFVARKCPEIARWHLLSSVAYLPCLFALMLFDKAGVR